MQTTVIPATTCDAIDRLIQNFVWGSSDEVRKVLQGKYMKEDANGLTQRNLTSQSAVWKGLSREWSNMLLGARTAIRNGRETSFWTARWLDSRVRLIDAFTGNTEELDLSQSVADFVNDDGQWDVERLFAVLPADAVSAVVGMPTPREDCGEDEWIWGGESNGSFSIKSAYRIICRSELSGSQEMWKQVWSWRGPNRIRCFLWLAIQEKLLTNSSRVRRNLTGDATCAFCQDPDESAAHVLRDCRFAAEAWRKLGSFDVSSDAWRGDFKEWMIRNLKQVTLASKREGTTIGNEARNFLFDVRWEPGPEGWMVLNSDGSVNQQTGRAAAGGVVRDSEGRCLLAYSMNLGCCSITRAEIRGAIEGLVRVWDAGFRKVVLRMDSRAAISILTSSDDSAHQYTMEKMEFRDLSRRDWSLKVEHTFREGNRSADFLASLGYGYPFGSHSVLISDCRLGYFLRLDCFGISEPRLISIND
ncbi:Putative ribonuclease H protein At1g65750 [Linum perenne]